jgi:diguanylate cyclase (GGDEF)-like protein/PAS domain S-box-containing protein
MEEDFFERIVNCVDAPLYMTDPEGTILYANPAFEELTGYRREEVVGRKTSVIKSGKMPNSYYERLWSTLLAGKKWKEEIINSRKDGTDYTVLQSITPLFDETGVIRYFAAVQYDVTREKKLQREREIFFDVSVDLFCIIDPQGAFIQTNGAWRDILGWGTEELAGRRIDDFVHPEEREYLSQKKQRLVEEGGIISLDIRVKDSGGAYRWISWRGHFNEERQLFYASGRDIQDRVEMEEEIRRISVTDALTGVYNRMKFDEEIERELTRSIRYDVPLTLIMFDIDHFKDVNDTYGHSRGDTVLRELVQLVREQLRDSDGLFRWGGEEFSIICPHTEAADARNIAERVRNTVETQVFEGVGVITISAGVGSFRQMRDTAESLLQRTDEALYEAKRRGRNRVASAES